MRQCQVAQMTTVSPICKQKVSWKFKGHGILSYFGRVQNYLELRKPGNSRSLSWKNTKKITISHQGTRMVKDKED